MQVFPYWGDGGVLPPAQNSLIAPPTWKNSSPPPPPPPKPNKNVIFSCSHSCNVFVIISYSFVTLVMLILILSDVQYSQNAILSFEKDSNHQNLPRFSPPGKKFPLSSVHYFLT